MEHTVRHGETLHSIANRYGVTVTAIMHANRLHSEHIHPGQRLYIPVHVQYHPTQHLAHPSQQLAHHAQQLSSHEQRLTALEQRLHQLGH